MFLMCPCGFACASERASSLHFPRYPLHRAGANAAFPSNRQHAFARKMALDSFQRRVKPIQKTRRKRCRRSAGSNILFPCPESSALSIRCGVLLGTHGCALNVCGLTQKAFEQVAKCLDPLVGRRLRAVEIEDIETLETIVQADTRDVEATAVEVRVGILEMARESTTCLSLLNVASAPAAVRSCSRSPGLVQNMPLPKISM